MEKLSFFIPVRFDTEPKTLSQSLLELGDQYFFLGGKQAHVISDDVVTLESEKSSPCWLTALKILSYFTLIIPIGILLAKICLRSAHPFYIALEEKTEELSPYRISSRRPKLKRMSDQMLSELEKKANELIKANRLLARERKRTASLLGALKARYGVPTMEELMKI
jgi:hypothetical protein